MNRRAMAQLIAVRILQFFREPEAIFWTYGFPLIMVLVLGLAFRSKSAQTLRSELSALPGVLQAEVSYESKTARVFVDPSGTPPSDEEIEKVIESAGYRGVPITTAESRTVSIRIDGMTCAGCVGGLQGSLASVPGVEKANVDYEKKRATVQLLANGDTDALLAAIAEQGFDGHLEAPHP